MNLDNSDAKLQRLLRYEGANSIEQFLEARGFDCVCPGICGNPDCDYIVNVESDQEQGWCEECQENTIVALFVLADVI